MGGGDFGDWRIGPDRFRRTENRIGGWSLRRIVAFAIWEGRIEL